MVLVIRRLDRRARRDILVTDKMDTQKIQTCNRNAIAGDDDAPDIVKAPWVDKVQANRSDNTVSTITDLKIVG